MDFTKKRHKMWKPLEGRTYRYKKSAMEFFCPLCRTKRNFSISFRLSIFNYIQIFTMTGFFTALTYSLWGLRGAFVFFIILPIFEFVRRSLFKKEIPCPHCGFDASWYKRDVRKARSLVSEFWEKGEQEDLQMAPLGNENLELNQNLTEKSAQF